MVVAVGPSVVYVVQAEVSIRTVPGVVPTGVAKVVVKSSGPGLVTVTHDSGGASGVVSTMTVPGFVPDGGTVIVVGVGPSVVYVVHAEVSTTTVPGVVPTGVAIVVVRSSGPGLVMVTHDSGGGGGVDSGGGAGVDSGGGAGVVSIITLPGLVSWGGMVLVVATVPSVVQVVQDGVSITTVPGVVPTGVATVVVRSSGPGLVTVTHDSGMLGVVSTITVPGLVPSGGTVIVVATVPSVVYVVHEDVSTKTVPGVVPWGVAIVVVKSSGPGLVMVTHDSGRDVWTITEAGVVPSPGIVSVVIMLSVVVVVTVWGGAVELFENVMGVVIGRWGEVVGV